jgi:hypothetical protein
VISRLDLEGVGDDRRAAMRSGAEPHEMRREADGAVVAVVGAMMESDADSRLHIKLADEKQMGICGK